MWPMKDDQYGPMYCTEIERLSTYFFLYRIITFNKHITYLYSFCWNVSISDSIRISTTFFGDRNQTSTGWIPALSSLPATVAREPWRLGLEAEDIGADGLRVVPTSGQFSVSRGPLEAGMLFLSCPPKNALETNLANRFVLLCNSYFALQNFWGTKHI